MNSVLKTNIERKKVIVHLIFSFTVGGAENLVVDLVNNQVTSHEVYLIIVNNIYSHVLLKAVDAKVKKIFINRNTGSRNILKLLWLNYLLFKITPDIIHCHNDNTIRLLFLFRKRTVLTIHDVNMPVRTFCQYKKIVAISEAVKNDVETRSGFKLKPEIVYNAVDFSEVQRKEDWNLNNQIKIVQVSRLMHEKKGQDILVQAVSELENKGYNIYLTLVGSGQSLGFIKDLISKCSLEDVITIEEGKDRTWVHANLKNFDLLVQPSRYEGFGLTIIEAIAAKVPVVASDLDGPKEILQSGKYGELFERGNIAELTSKIEKIIILYTKGEIKEKTDKAYSYASDLFSLQSMLDGYEKVYNSLN